MILNFNQERHSAFGGNGLRSQACICPSDGPQPRVFWIGAPCEADFAKEFAVAIWLSKTSFWRQAVHTFLELLNSRGWHSTSTEAATDKFHTLHRDSGSSSACRPGIHRGNGSSWGELYKHRVRSISHKAELETPLCSFVKGSISSYIEEHSWQWHLRELLHYLTYDNSKVIAGALAASRLAAGGCTWYLWCPCRREERSQTSKSYSPRLVKSLYSTEANAANRQTRRVVPRLQSCNSFRRKVLSEETRARPPIWPRNAPFSLISCYNSISNM